jgi:signal transduction histidine kinase
MDPKRLVLYCLVMTLFLAALAAGAYTGLREVAAEAEAINRRLDLVVRVEPVADDLREIDGYPVEQRAEAAARLETALRRNAALLRDATAGGPVENEGRNLESLVATILEKPTEPALLADAFASARILRNRVLKEAQEALKEGTDRPAARRARWILWGSVGATSLGIFVFTMLFLRAMRERRAAEERVRRAEVLAALGTLAAGVAHEVNNPLGTIAACSDAALGRLRAEKPDLAKAAAHVETALSEARRCAEIVRDLMDFARDGPPAAGPVDLPALVRETASLATLNPKVRKIPIEVSAAEGVPLLVADAARLKQALLNLLSNAAEVSPEGSRIEVAVSPHGPGAEVTVRDHGPGVPQAERRRIFEPFRSGRAGGTGLGLTIVDRVAAAHGGSVEVEDAPGGGALFRLRLPARASN